MITRAAVLLACFLAAACQHVRGPTEGEGTAGSAEAAQVRGPKAGFRGLRWGDAPKKDMIRLPARQRNMDLYFLPGDSRYVAGFDAAAIHYSFSRGGFCEVEIAWSLPEGDVRLVSGKLRDEWGEPSKTYANEWGFFEQWRSADGLTGAFLKTVPDRTDTNPLRPLRRVLLVLAIRDVECVARAVSDPGL